MKSQYVDLPNHYSRAVCGCTVIWPSDLKFTLPLSGALGKAQFYLVRNCRQVLRFSNNAFRFYCSSKDLVEFQTIRISQDGKNMNDVHSILCAIQRWHVVNHITETTQPAPFVTLLTLAYLHQILALRTGPHIRRPWLSRSPHMAMIPLEGCLAAQKIPPNNDLWHRSGSLYARKEKLNRLNLEILGYPIFEINIHTGTNLKPFVTPTVWFAIFHKYIYIYIIYIFIYIVCVFFSSTC